MGIVSAFGFTLAVEREVGNSFEVSDDACEVIQIFAPALGAFIMQEAFVDVPAIFTQGVRNVEREVVASFTGGNAEQLPVLCKTEMLVQIHVESRAAGEMLDVAAAVQAELLDDVRVGIFYDVEIGIIAVARYEIAGFTVPTGVFHTDVLRRNHLTVEEHVF